MRTEPIRLKVWIDQTSCTHDGKCHEVAPTVFQRDNNGLLHVVDVEGNPIETHPNDHVSDGNVHPFREIDGRDVPLFNAIEDAADACDAGCIYIGGIGISQTTANQTV